MALYELTIDPHDASDFHVVSFTGVEQLSRTFSFLVVVQTSLGTADVEGLLGQPATFTVQVPQDGDASAQAGGGTPRTVQGIVASVEPKTRSAVDDRRGYVIRLVPKLWLLRRRKNSRVFQGKRVDEIVETLLDEGGVAHTFSLTDYHPTREYCVQYEESDYDFIRRILAERGIFFFEPSDDSGGAGTMILADRPTAYPPVPDASGAAADPSAPSPSVPFRDSSAKSASEAVSVFSTLRAVKSKSTLVRDYDYTHPSLDLAAWMRSRARRISRSAVRAARAG